MSITNQVSNNYEITGILTIGEKLYLNEQWADFHFEFESENGQCRRVPAHKIFLAEISDVFCTMFNGTWKEKKDVKIVDATIAEFGEFLQFFYLGRAQLTKVNIAKIMYLADKYNVDECMRMCGKFMTSLLSAYNVCWGFELAILYNQQFLKKYCKTIISLDTKAVFASETFLECNQDTITNILQLNSLSCSEVEVFEACMSWIKSVSQQEILTRKIVEEYLGESFDKIRFGTMTLEEFTSIDPSYEEIFLFDEYRTIIKRIANSENEPPRKKFKSSPSTVHCNRLLSKKYSNAPYYIKNTETTKFSVNEPLLLNGFQCDKVTKFQDNKQYCKVKKKLPTKVTIIEIPNQSNGESVLHAGNVDIKPCLYTEVNLAKPILIRPGFMYAIQMELSAPDKACTGLLLKSEVKLDSNVIVKFHCNSTRDDDKGIARGLIFRLEFNEVSKHRH